MFLNIGKLILVAGISLALVFCLQLPSLSLKNMLIVGRAFTVPELAAMELAVGAANSLVVTGLSVLAIRRPLWMPVTTAIVVQLWWVTVVQRQYPSASSPVEFLLNWSLPFGVLLGGVAIMYIARRLGKKDQATIS